MKSLRIPGAWLCLAAWVTGGLLTGGPVVAAAGEPPAPRAGAREGGPETGSLDPRLSPEARGEAPRESDSGSPEDPVRWQPSRSKHSHKWGLVGAGAGLVAGVGLALWVKSEADDRYEIYLDTADPDAAEEALESAERYDRATLIGWALAQVSFVAFVYFLTREGERPLVPVTGEPLVRPQEDGLEIGFRVAP